MSFENRESPRDIGHSSDEEPQAEQEREKSLGIEFFVTDHNVRYPETISIGELRELYADMKRHGISSVRFDIDWREVMPDAATRHEGATDRYADIIKTMKEVGMGPPTLVLSSPPEWISELYKNDKESFFRAYGEYMTLVADLIRRSESPIHSVQLFNEINHSFLFKFVDVEDLPKLSHIVRDTLGKVQPDIKLATSLIAGNINDTIADRKGEEPIDAFLTKHEATLKESFDVISVDYYPGVYHLPLKEANYRLKDTFKQLDMLKSVFERIAAWGKEYEIGEVGFPTNAPYSTEDRQRYFYDSFFKAFRQLLVEFKKRNIALPSRVGLYETQNEENISFGGLTEKILRSTGIHKASRLLANPEHDFGLRKGTGEWKNILRGGRHEPKEKFLSMHLNDKEQLSQLAKIVRYVNRPIDAAESR